MADPQYLPVKVADLPVITDTDGLEFLGFQNQIFGRGDIELLKAKNMQLQYSNDSINWHSTPVDGDMYFRTSNDGGVTWSPALLYSDRLYTDGKIATEAAARHTEITDAVNVHNTDGMAHQDIRTLIQQANAAITSGDAATLQSALQALTDAMSAHNIDSSAHQDIRTLIVAITALIPNQATPENQLADKDFVNSSLNSIAAHRLSYNAAGDRFPTKADLTNATTFYYNGAEFAPTVNDYTVVAADESENGAEVRYRYTGSQWVIDYVVNDTPFTDAQNKAINSGITAELTDKLANPDANPTQNSANLVSSGGVWSWFGAALSTLKTTAKTIIGSINELFDTKVDKVTSPVQGNIPVLNADGSISDSGKAYPTSLPASGGTADDVDITGIGFGYGDGLEDLFVVADNQPKGVRVYSASYIQNDPVNPKATDRNIFGAVYFIKKISDTVGDDWSISCYPTNYGNNGGYIYTINKTLGVIDGWRRINDNGNAATVNGKTHRDYDTVRGVMMNGLLWDTGNIADYVTFDDANRAAAAMGKRLPTQAEFAALAELPNEWDNVLRGRWFAATTDDLATKDKTKCLFFPAVGSYDINNKVFAAQNEYGYYWSSTQGSDTTGVYTRIGNNISAEAITTKIFGLSVRCVQDNNPKLLDADTLGGRKFDIYVQSAEPANSLPGDIWIKP